MKHLAYCLLILFWTNVLFAGNPGKIQRPVYQTPMEKISAQNIRQKISTKQKNLFRPTHQMIHYWNGTGYDTTSMFFYQYVGNTLLISEMITQMWMGGYFENYQKDVHFYDQYERDTCTITYFWSLFGKNWEPSTKYTTSFDNQGNTTFEGYWIYQDGQFFLYEALQYLHEYNSSNLLTSLTVLYYNFDFGWINQFRVLYEYDSQNRLKAESYQYWDEMLQNWFWGSRTEYFYQNNVWSEVIGYFWDDFSGTWVPDIKFSDITWHNFGEQLPLYYKFWYHDGLNWYLAGQVFYSYNSQSLPLEILTQLFDNGMWINNYRSLWQYDAYFNLTLYLEQNWNGNDWEISYGEQLDYVYDQFGNIIVEYYSNYDMFYGTWFNVYKLESWYENITRVSGVKPANFSVQISPNPVMDELQLTIHQPLIQTTQWKILSIGSNLVKKGTISPQTTHLIIPVTDLPQGMYLLILENHSQLIREKFIVIR